MRRCRWEQSRKPRYEKDDGGCCLLPYACTLLHFIFIFSLAVIVVLQAGYSTKELRASLERSLRAQSQQRSEGVAFAVQGSLGRFSAEGSDDNGSDDSDGAGSPQDPRAMQRPSKKRKTDVPRTLIDLFQKTGQCKAASASAHVCALLQQGVKLLVFAHHTAVLDVLEQRVSRLLSSRDQSWIRIDGATPAADRQSLVEQYQTDARCRCAVLSLTAASTGLTLTAGTVAVFAELFWTPALLLQAEDRIHRIGQQEEVSMHYIVGTSTLDDVMWPLLTAKLEKLGKALNGANERMSFRMVRTLDGLGIQNEGGAHKTGASPQQPLGVQQGVARSHSRDEGLDSLQLAQLSRWSNRVLSPEQDGGNARVRARMTGAATGLVLRRPDLPQEDYFSPDSGASTTATVYTASGSTQPEMQSYSQPAYSPQLCTQSAPVQVPVCPPRTSAAAAPAPVLPAAQTGLASRWAAANAKLMQRYG